MKNTLTQSDKLRMSQIREKWIGYCGTLELNKKQAKKSVEWLYEFSGLKKPKVVFVDSPMAIQIACNMLKVMDQKDQVWEQVMGQVWEQVWGQVWEQVRGQVFL